MKKNIYGSKGVLSGEPAKNKKVPKKSNTEPKMVPKM